MMIMMTMIAYDAFVLSPYSLQWQHCGSAKIFPAFLLMAIPSTLLEISMGNLYGYISYITVY
jgi:hypothetical protein